MTEEFKQFAHTERLAQFGGRQGSQEYRPDHNLPNSIDGGAEHAMPLWLAECIVHGLGVVSGERRDFAHIPERTFPPSPPDKT